jgi:MFS family permease
MGLGTRVRLAGTLTPVRQMYLVAFFSSLSYMAATSVFPPFARELGFEVGAIGVLMSVYAVASLLSRLPTGALLHGPRAPLAAAVGVLCQAASTVAYTLVDSYGALFALRAIGGLAYGVVTTVNLTLLMGAIERPEQRGAVTGWYLFWMAAAYAVGNYVTGFLVDWLGYHATFRLAAAVPLAVLPLLGLRAALRPPRAIAVGQPGQAFAWRDLRALASLALLVPALQAFTVNALCQVMWVFYPLYGLGVGLSLGVLGVQRGAYSSASMLTRPFVGQAGQRLGYHRIATAALITSAGLTALVPLFTGFWPLLGLHILLGGLRSGALVGSMAATIEYGGADARQRGLAAGMYNFATDAGNILGPLVGGLLAEQFGLPALFVLLPALLLAVYLGLLGASWVVAARQRPLGRAEA